ncbi:MAG: hypothetical protein AB1427_09390 [Thermodesulfobacteriota bacterium]
MKRCFGFLVAVFFVIGIVGFSGSSAPCLAGDVGPVVALGTPLVKEGKKVDVVIMGSGFKPGEDVSLLIYDDSGLQTDIGYALKPLPKADETGTWATTWNATDFLKKKIIKPGPCKITAADGEYNPVAHTVVFFQKAEKKDDKGKKDKK